MLPANRHLLPVIGIDIHIVIILGAPVPVPHPFIGLVFDPMDWVPKIGSTVSVNGIPRGNSGTNGMLGAKVHIPMGGPFATPPTIGHNSVNFFGSMNVKAEGSLFTPAGFMVMSCNDVGVPLSLSAGKKFKPVPTLYLPTSASIPIPGGKPVIVGGPYVPDLMGMLMSLVMSFGFSALMKIGGSLLKKALTKLNSILKKKLGATNSLSKFLCKHGFEPVNLITGSVVYEGIDFELPGPIPVKWERNWYSDSHYKGPLGHGTHLSYDLSLHVFEKDNGIGVMLPDGRVTAFPLTWAPGAKSYNRTEKLTLTCIDKTHYELFDHKSQLFYLFEKLYDNVFKQVSIANFAGSSIRFSYNNKYCLEKITDTAGREILVKLDNHDRIIRVEGQHNGVQRLFVEYTYNDAGDLTSITDANGRSTSIRYRNHLMVEKTDRNGQTFSWEYDGNTTGARCVHTTGDGGLLEGWIEYKKGHNIVTNSLGEKKIYYYDENNLCIQETDALGNSVFHEYTDFMEPYRNIDEEGNITGFVYDALGNMTALQKPDGGVNNFLYDEWGRLQMTSNAEGNSTIYVYKDNRLKSVVRADQSVTGYEYFSNGFISNIKNSRGQRTQLQYDEDNNLALMILPDGTRASWEYDAWGRCLESVNPENKSQHFMYDAIDRVTEIKQYDGNYLKLKYDGYDKVVLAADIDHTVKFEYTPLGKLKSREENGSRVQFNYNTEQRIVSFVNEHQELYRFGYDACGNIIHESGFDGLQRQYQRDRTGKVIRIMRPGNKFTTHEYDASGRVTRTEYSDGGWEIFSYNKNGQLIEAANETGQLLLERDASGRVIKENQDGHAIENVFDEMGRRTAITSSLGAFVKIARKDNGFVDSIFAQNEESTHWEARFKYNSLGQETERLLPGGISTLFLYDNSGHPTEHSILNGSESIRHRIYSWNVNHRLQKMVDGLTRGTVQYGHDEFGQLAWTKYETGQYEFRMPDKTGNLYKTRERTDCKYGSGGKLLESEGIKYDYDDEGNLVSKISPDGKQCRYEWSGRGMLQKVVLPDGKEICFEYDALGRRTAKIYNGSIKRWLWNGNIMLHEWKYPLNDRARSIIDEFGEITPGKPEPIIDLITWVFDEGSLKPAAKLQGKNQYSIINDYLGTPVEMYDNKGIALWKVEHDTRGKIRDVKTGSAGDCPFRYLGQYEDEETGLYYNRFRYYAPDEGLYLNQDPIRLLGGHRLYAYVEDVLSKVDPFGLNDCQGVAKIHHYPPDAENPYGHYSIEVTQGGQTVHTHQVITSPDMSKTTITDDVSFLEAPIKTVEVPLPDASAAMSHQGQLVGENLGPYNQRTNSCVDHVSDVLREGGVPVPEGALKQYKYLKGLGF